MEAMDFKTLEVEAVALEQPQLGLVLVVPESSSLLILHKYSKNIQWA
jgi:hypothetical protein